MCTGDENFKTHRSYYLTNNHCATNVEKCLSLVEYSVIHNQRQKIDLNR